MRASPTCGKCGAVKVLRESGKSVCLSCAAENKRAYKLRHPDRVAASHALYRTENREALNEKKRLRREQNPSSFKDYYQANADRIKARTKRYRAENPEKVKNYFKQLDSTPERQAANRERLRAWKARNPAKVNAATAKRYAQKLRAIPSWTDLKDIEAIYELARLRTELTGIDWHVDHAVPLNSDLVCGLHCEANLQVIPAGPNISKGNNWWPDMLGRLHGPCCSRSCPPHTSEPSWTYSSAVNCVP